MKSPIEINDLTNFTSYIIKSLDEAKDDFDRNLAMLVIEHDDIITMGKFIARYIGQFNDVTEATENLFNYMDNLK